MKRSDRLFDVIYGDFWSKAYKFPEEGDFVSIPIKKTDGGRYQSTGPFEYRERNEPLSEYDSPFASHWHNPVTDIFGKDNLIYARPDSYVWVD